MLPEPSPHLGDHFPLHPFDGLRRFDHTEACGLCGCEDAKPVAHALVEGEDFSLEAVLGPAATMDSGEPVRHRAVEKKGERRRDTVPGTGIEAPHHVQVEAPAVAL